MMTIQKGTMCPKLRLTAIQSGKKRVEENPFLVVSQYALTDRSETTSNFPDINRMRRSEPAFSKKTVRLDATRLSLDQSAANRLKGDSSVRHQWQKKAPKPIDTSDGRAQAARGRDNEGPKKDEEAAPKCGGLMDVFQQIKCTNLLIQRLNSIRRKSGEFGISPQSPSSRKSPLRQSALNTPKPRSTKPQSSPSPTKPTAADEPLLPSLGSAKRRAAMARPVPSAIAVAPEAVSRLRYLPGCGRVLVIQKPRASPLRQRFATSPGISPFKPSSPGRSPMFPAAAAAAAAGAQKPVVKVLRASAGAAGLAPRRRQGLAERPEPEGGGRSSFQ
jgi:hypothetical protein